MYGKDQGGRMSSLVGNRVSEIISDEFIDESSRMSDMSNMTLGIQMASLNLGSGSPNIEIKQSPFQHSTVSVAT